MGELCTLAASIILQPSTSDPCVTTEAAIASVPATAAVHPAQSRAIAPIEQHQPAHTPQPTLAPVIEFSLEHRERPRSGSQLYQQRWAALRAGQTHTRLPVHSFASQWRQATHPPTHNQWLELLAREAQSMAGGQGSNRLTVFVGDSLSLWMPTEFLPRHRFWLNQSVSGETAAGMLKRLHYFDHTRPDVIHVMAGINDLKQGATNTEVLKSLWAMMRKLRQTHPQAKIFVHSILPTRLPHLDSDRIRLLNQYLAHIAQREGTYFLDLQDHFTDPQGNLHPELTTDGLHLNYQGYALWQSIFHQVSS